MIFSVFSLICGLVATDCVTGAFFCRIPVLFAAIFLTIDYTCGRYKVKLITIPGSCRRQFDNLTVHLAVLIHCVLFFCALAIRDMLGFWLHDGEGASSLMQIVTELQNRGVEDIIIACVDGLKWIPEAIETVFPHTQIQLCIVHMIQGSQ